MKAFREKGQIDCYTVASITCPICGAPAGQRCRTIRSSGHRITRSHPERIKLYRQQRDAQMKYGNWGQL